ncbi:MAG: ATP-binding protein, partial [Anaerolineales bacterium]|nr:ATP-binding protein [Anaerolineales bacterium]
MQHNRLWEKYPPTYRAQEVQTVLQWIQTGNSGSVVGLPGSGKSNFLGFLCHHPQALPPHETAIQLIPIDFNILPDRSLATFYRVILRAFYETQPQFTTQLQVAIHEPYQSTKDKRDPFLPQRALRELLLQFRQRQQRVVLVIDRFDDFCEHATPAMTNTLRGLRDHFKDTLCYIMGLRHDIAYLSDPTILGELYELLDLHTCWIGPMSKADAQHLVHQETHLATRTPTNKMIDTLINLTGGYPALLKTACHWWQQSGTTIPQAQWANALLANRSIRHRLQELWDGLDQEEQHTLSQLQTPTFTPQNKHAPDQDSPIQRLLDKGILWQTDEAWQLFSPLLAKFIAANPIQGRGKLWVEPGSAIVHQGDTVLQDLTQLEHALLVFLLR